MRLSLFGKKEKFATPPLILLRISIFLLFPLLSDKSCITEHSQPCLSIPEHLHLNEQKEINKKRITIHFTVLYNILFIIILYYLKLLPGNSRNEFALARRVTSFSTRQTHWCITWFTQPHILNNIFIKTIFYSILCINSIIIIFISNYLKCIVPDSIWEFQWRKQCTRRGWYYPYMVLLALVILLLIIILNKRKYFL